MVKNNVLPPYTEIIALPPSKYWFYVQWLLEAHVNASNFLWSLATPVHGEIVTALLV